MLRALARRLVRFAMLARNICAGIAALCGALLVAVLVQGPTEREDDEQLILAFLHDKHHAETKSTALQKLSDRRHISSEIGTERSESPFWLLSRELSHQDVTSSLIEVPSRHVVRLSFFFFDADGRELASGEADRNHIAGKIKHSRAGYAIIPPECAQGCRILLKVVSVGPARLQANLRSVESLDVLERFFERSGGVLYGSLLMIAAFSFLISLLSREFAFFLFGSWVIASLRIASYSAGWDMGWLGAQIFEDYPVISRNIPLAAYALLTVALFWSIFKKEVSQIGAVWLIRSLLCVCVGLILLAGALSHKSFLPILWLIVIPSVAILILLTLVIYIKTGSSIAAWYGASWLATFSGALGDVAYAAGLTASKPTLANSLAASLAAALLAGIAIAQRLNTERYGRVQAQRTALDALEDIRTLHNQIPLGLFRINPFGRVDLSNPAFDDLLQVRSMRNPKDHARIDDLLGQGTHALLQEVANRSSGSDVEIEASFGSPCRGRWFLAKVTAKGDSIEGSIQDITERKEAEAKLLHLVDHDSLTGVGNRRGLERAMLEAQQMIARGTPCAIAQVSLDRFKLINDLYGHGVGDLMLQQASARVIQAVRAGDYVSRIADSFVVVFFDCPDFAVLGLTERLRECVQQGAFEIDGKRLDMTASVGVVSFDPSKDFVDTLASVGRACAEAKARGRNCVVRLDESDSRLRAHLEEMRVVADLKRNINTDRYFLNFQPIVSLVAPHSTLNYEVLLRMRDENGGVIPPGRFIGAAERNGLMSDIDRWVLRAIFEWLDGHPEHLSRIGFTTVNISGASLNDSRFIEDAFAMFADHPAAMRKLCFEITESVALTEIQTTRRFIDRIREYGGKLALDDFGAGYTSFNYLKEIPADFIKIDGIFVRDINLNPANFTITRTIVDLTHELGMQSIAEWAETAKTVETLVSIGVDYGQGFALARAMDKEPVTQALSCGDLVKDAAVLAVMKRPPLALARTLA